MPTEPILAGYRFDPSLRGGGQYRDLRTGRLVARQKIVELLEAQVQQRADRLARLTMNFASNEITARDWLNTMRDELRRAHLQNRALGAGGWGKLTPHDFGAVGRALQDDYRRLIGFASGIARGEVSEAQALNRLNMYLGQARKQYWIAQQERAVANVKAGMLVMARRYLGIAEHCNSCVVYARAGWQPVEHLPPPGEGSECDGNCRCTRVLREVSIADAPSLRKDDLPAWNA